MKKVILASASPRRKELLLRIIDNFQVKVVNCQEIDYGLPQLVAIKNAQAKASKLMEQSVSSNEIVIACDTVVAKNNKIFGKPKNIEQARQVLKELKGDWHDVVSGVFVQADRQYAYSVCSKVFIKDLSDKQIEEYILEFAPYDKAGAYGIQDEVVVGKYKGDYENIIGLPLDRLREILRENGVDVKE